MPSLDRKKGLNDLQAKRIVVINHEKCKPRTPAFDYLNIMPSLDRIKGLDNLQAKRIVVINHEKCKPRTPAFDYLKSHAKRCGRECIEVKHNRITVSENACMMCFNIAKRTPGDSVRVVNLPTNLTTDTVYSYGPNSFKIHGLAIPQPGRVLGLLGTNGIGKSTIIKILSGEITPNFGNFRDGKIIPATKREIIKYYRGSELQNYFTSLYNKLTISHKPQNISEYLDKYQGLKLNEILATLTLLDDFNKSVNKLQLDHLMDHKIEQLSGGELQRFAILLTLSVEADVYFFDEPTSYLDVKQRLTVTELIRSIVENQSKYVIVVEHDLAILDYISDYIQIVYGTPGVYGVVTQAMVVNNGINQFMAGYLTNENIRFRSYSLNFKTSSDNQDTTEITKNTGFSYPEMIKSYGDIFSMTIKPGTFQEKQVTAILGQNGCGKTTFMNMMADYLKLHNNPISYKRQETTEYLDFKGTVQDLMELKINSQLGNRFFRLLVLNPLKIDALKDLPVASLSGGEMQRLMIIICLGIPASVYLLDEPSAGLDCIQRLIVAKVIRRWLINHLETTCLLIEHDFLISSTISDKVIIYDGIPGVKTVANSPIGLVDGFNRFLKQLEVTFRRDIDNHRPMINKKNSVKDMEQKTSGNYFLF